MSVETVSDKKEVVKDNVDDLLAKCIKIKAELRSESGKGVARRLRRDGKIPGNILQTTKASKSVLIELESALLKKAWNSGRTFILELNGSSRLVKMQELQITPVKRTPLHVDLMYV